MSPIPFQTALCFMHDSDLPSVSAVTELYEQLDLALAFYDLVWGSSYARYARSLDSAWNSESCCRQFWLKYALFFSLSHSQAARRPRSPTPSSQPGSPTRSPPPAPRGAWAAVAATKRSRASTTRTRAGSGAAALQMSSSAWDSPRCLWTRGRSSRTPGLSWIYTTTKWDARYVSCYSGIWPFRFVLTDQTTSNLL